MMIYTYHLQQNHSSVFLALPKYITISQLSYTNCIDIFYHQSQLLVQSF